MKRAVWIGGLILAALALYLVFSSQSDVPLTQAPALSNSPPVQTKPVASTKNAAVTATSNSSAPGDSNKADAASSAPQPASLAAKAGMLAPLDASEAANIPPETVLENMRRAVRQYGEMFGGNPVGTNPEITAQLAGDNPKHINFTTAQPGLHANEKGELVDPWGTPYFFHQISGSEMEIHSAGPDKVMWTSDDLVTK
jgi:hypothetical protein